MSLPAISPEGRFKLGDVEFQMDLAASQARRKSDASCFTIVKSKPYLDHYAQLAETVRPRTILELGIFQGGGFAFLDQLFKPQRMAARRLQPGRGDRLAAGKQRYPMAAPDQPVGKMGDDAFRAAVEQRRHGLVEGRDLGDAHQCLCDFGRSACNE